MSHSADRVQDPTSTAPAAPADAVATPAAEESKELPLQLATNPDAVPAFDTDSADEPEVAEPTPKPAVPSAVLAPTPAPATNTQTLNPESAISANAILCKNLALANPRDIREWRYDNGFVALEKRVKGIRDAMGGFKKKLHQTMHPSLYGSLKLGDIVLEMNEILDMIARQETRSARDIEEATMHKLDLPSPEVTIVDEAEDVKAMLEAMMGGIVFEELTEDPVFSIDTESGSDGVLSLMQIYVHATKHTYLVGIHFLKDAAFSTAATINGTTWTLKSILESNVLRKLFFDCRGDSTALFEQYNITLAGVIDCQLLDHATRNQPEDRARLHSFSEALTMRMRPHFTDASLNTIRQTKAYGVLAILKGHTIAEDVFDVFQGDVVEAQREIDAYKRQNAALREAGQPGLRSEEVDAFTLRPLPEIETKYVVQDVSMLHFIYYRNFRHVRYSEEWDRRVKAETEKRLAESRDLERMARGGNAPPELWLGFGHVDREVDPNWWL